VYAWTEEVADGEYEHYAALCDDDGEPLGDPTVCDSAGDAEGYATTLGNRLGLEVITDDLMR
jgi:hypothetical protein